MDLLEATNGNIELGLAKYWNPENFDKAMQECMNATGLTKEEICANYGIDFVASYDKTGLLNVSSFAYFLSIIPGWILVIAAASLIALLVYVMYRLCIRKMEKKEF